MQLFYYPEYHTVERNVSGYLQLDDVSPIGLRRGDLSIQLPTIVNQNALLATMEVTPAVLDILRPGENELEIDAVNEMGEPWYTGRAEPLFRLAERCQ